MSISRNEETGIKPTAWQSSDYIAGAGVPIKKRRFPIIRSPSPPLEEPSSLQAENDSINNNHSSLSPGYTLSNASGAISCGLSDTSKNFASAEKKGGSDVNTSKGFVSEEKKGSSDVNNVNVVPSKNIYSKLEQRGLTTDAGSFDAIDSKEKLLVVENFEKKWITPGATDLQLDSYVHPVSDAGKKFHGKQTVEGKYGLEVSEVSENTELLLRLEEHLDIAKAVQSNDESGQTPDILLNLSLSKGNSNTECRIDEVPSNLDNSHLHADRSNWDLNTTMNTWEGPVSNPAAVQVTTDGLNADSSTDDIKPFICSSLIVEAVVSERQFHKESMPGSSFSTPYRQSGQPYNSEDSIKLQLSPSFLQPNFSQEPSGSSAKVTVPNSNRAATTGKMETVNYRTVKSEPCDNNVKQDHKEARADCKGPDCRAVKPELVEKCSLEALKSPECSALKLVDPISIKCEPVHQGNEALLKKIEHLSGKPTCSTELTISRGNDRELCAGIKGAHPDGELLQEACDNPVQVASEAVSHDCKESNVFGMIDGSAVEDDNTDDPQGCSLKFVCEFCPGRGNGETSVSDEERVNISGDILEEDSYGSDYESDGNHSSGVVMDAEEYGVEDDDYEDGEVREPLVQTETEGLLFEGKEIEHVSLGNADCKKMTFLETPCDGRLISSLDSEKDPKTENHGETNDNDVKECVDTVNEENANKGSDCASVQEPSAIEIPTDGGNKKMNLTEREPLDISGKEDSKSQETGQLTDQANSGSLTTLLTVAQGADENIKKIAVLEKNPTTEATSNRDDAAKDISSGGNRSRIINLSQAYNSSSPGKLKLFSGRSLPSRDVPNEGDKLHPRGRDENYVDGSPKFSREGHRDQSYRSSRFNFVRGRGRGSSRLDTIRGKWNSEHDSASEFYNGPTDFRVPRQKYSSAVSDADLDYRRYNTAPDGAFVGSGRRGRKISSDEGPIFRHIPTRRWTPGGRDGPTGHGLQMDHRIGRNISPSRCIGEDASDLMRLRHRENLMRDFPDDNREPGFTRPKSPYEGVDFVRGKRKVSSLQRRGLPQMRSKSPITSRTRSPDPWSSPRRRSPDGFSGQSELPHRRSPAVYRMGRMGSPDPPCFTGERVVRRGSPPFLSRQSNELRDMDSGRDYGHQRSVILDRSTSGGVLIRNSRRFEVVDSRERTDDDEYFGPPKHSGRFHELEGDGNTERRFGERRGHIRPYRHLYNGVDSEHFQEDGRRPYRLHPEDSDFNERANSREREFDRRIKDRPRNAPRRTRSIDDQEGNFRHGGQVWHDEGFNNLSRVKRKRF